MHEPAASNEVIIIERNKKRGLALVAAPMVSIVFVSTVATIIEATRNELSARPDMLSAIEFVIAGLALLSFIGFFTLLPYGIYLLTKRVRLSQPPPENVLDTQTLPNEARYWNWGAFVFGWIWGLGNGVNSALFSLIPIVGFFVRIYLGLKGSELAWQTGKWPTVAAFAKTQRYWAIAAGIFLAVAVLIAILDPGSMD